MLHNSDTLDILHTLLSHPHKSLSLSALTKETGIEGKDLTKALSLLTKEKAIQKTSSGLRLNYANAEVQESIKELLEEKILHSPNRVKVAAETLRKIDGAHLIVVYGEILEEKGEDIELLIVYEDDEHHSIEKQLRELQLFSPQTLKAQKYMKTLFDQQVKKKNKLIIEILTHGVVVVGHNNYLKILEHMR